MRVFQRRVRGLLFVTLAVFAGTAGVAFATGSLSSNVATTVIQACQNQQNGNLRVVGNNTTDCRASEVPISWNVVGQKGDQGVAGPQGPKGDTGAKGETGAAGAQGTKGDTGAKGETGATGAKGDTGATGAQGPKGDDGGLGPVGPQGPTGAVGPQGPGGPAGPQGPAGAQGPAGPQGPAGSGALQSMRVRGPVVAVGSLSAGESVASCPAGWVVTGGGYTSDNVTVYDSRQGPNVYAAAADNTWYTAGSTALFQSGTFSAWATCAKV